MPGHRSGQSWPEPVRSLLASLDTTELAATDDLHQPAGPALEAMQKAATFFGAGRTWFLTNGATGGILTLLAGLVGRGQKVILPRSCHLSVSHAIMLLDIQPVWLEFPPQAIPGPLGFLPEVTASQIQAAVNQHPDSRAVFLTCPDYYGRCADLSAISAVVHQAGLLLLVDEAHGAHFAAAPDLMPSTALASGADACVQSAHKTMPALTQGGYLHLSPGLPGKDPQAIHRIAAALRIFQTSSPSFAIGASLDYARAYLAQNGRRQIEATLALIRDLATDLGPDHLVSPASAKPGQGCNRDPLRIIIQRRGLPIVPAQVLARHLHDQGIDIELSDLTRLVLIPALDQPQQDFQRLRQALQLFQPAQAGQALAPDSLPDLERTWLDLLLQPPEAVLSPGEVLLGQPKTVEVPLETARGGVLAQVIAPYPPGIPLLLPGERLDRPRLDLLLALRNNGINLSGVDHDCIRVVV